MRTAADEEDRGGMYGMAGIQGKRAHLVGHVRNGVRALDVMQDPRAAALRHELPTEDTVLGEVHVCREDIRARAVLHQPTHISSLPHLAEAARKT